MSNFKDVFHSFYITFLKRKAARTHRNPRGALLFTPRIDDVVLIRKHRTTRFPASRCGDLYRQKGEGKVFHNLSKKFTFIASDEKIYAASKAFHLNFISYYEILNLKKP